ncbi:conjugal transfer protein TraG N-terminal domain-containing protein [Vibrio artabrorum]|uniref:conjugal transfer protein TraG N-terminal domain-containing protein n=1 Tax=Vibrio artabrorum TaxID=446374 RepID=UPI00354F6DB2
MVEVHVFSGGEVARQVLNAVAMFVSSASMTSILSTVAIISVPLTVLSFISTHSPKVIAGWCLVTLLVPTLLIKAKEDVQIIDSSNPMRVATVSNVPLILALPAYLSTTYMFGITKAVDGIFHTNDDAQYSKTGMLFGATLMRKNLIARIEDPRLQNLWQQYLTNCIRQDISINHKYSYKQLFSSPDILGFLKAHSPSPLRRIFDPYNKASYSAESGEYPTCKEALTVITKGFETEVADHHSWLKRLLGASGSDSALQSALYTTAQENANHALIDISTNAKNTIMQAMVTNATRTGLIDASNAVGADATAIRLMAAQTEIQSNAFMASTGLWAQKRIPMLQTVLLLLIMCASPIVVAIAMLPSMTFKVLTNTLYGYVYIASWPVVFTFINFISNAFGSNMMKSITDGQGVNFYNLNELHKTNLEMSAIAGWLMMLTPIITPFLIKGGASIMSSASMQFAGMVNSVGGQVSREIATGNVSLGNTNEDLHNYNNTNGNKHDTNYMDAHTMATKQLSNGAMDATTGAGGHVYNTQPSRSNLIDSISMREDLTNTLSASAQQAERAVNTASADFRQASSSAFNDTRQYLDSTSEQSGYGNTTSTGEQSSMRDGMSEMMQASQNYAKSHNVSDAAAWQVLAKGGASVGFSLAGTGASAGVEGSISGSHNDTDSQNTTNSLTDQQAFNHGLEQVRTASVAQNTNDSSSTSTQESNSVGDTFNTLTSAGKTLNTALNQEKAATLALSQSQTTGASVNSDMTMGFQNWLEDHPDKRGGMDTATLLTSNDNDVTTARKKLANKFVETLAETSINDQLNNITAEQVDNLKGQTLDSVHQAGQNKVDFVEQRGEIAVGVTDDVNNLKTGVAGDHMGMPDYNPNEKNQLDSQANNSLDAQQQELKRASAAQSPSALNKVDNPSPRKSKGEQFMDEHWDSVKGVFL